MSDILDSLGTVVSPVFLALLGTVFAASGDAVAKKGVATVSPRTFLTIRWIFSAFIYTSIVTAAGAWRSFVLDWRMIFVISGAIGGPVLAWTCFTRALLWLDVSVANPIRSISYILAVILAVPILGERVSPGIVAGVLLVTIGVYLVQLVPNARIIDRSVGRTSDPDRVRGLLLALIAAVIWGVTTVLFKLASMSMPVIEATWFRSVVPAALFGLFAIWTLGNLSGTKLAGRKPIRVTRAGVTAALAASLLADTLAWSLQFAAYRKGDLVVLAPLAQTGPLWIALMAWLFLGERLTIRRVSGIFLVVLGTIAVTAPV